MFHGLGCLLLCRSSMFTAFFSHIHLDFLFFLPSAILFLWNLFLHVTFFTLLKGFCCSLFGSLERKSVLAPFHLQLDSFSAVVKSAEKE
jgi:hypothetical protein